MNDPAPSDIYTLSLHDALPICSRCPPPRCPAAGRRRPRRRWPSGRSGRRAAVVAGEDHEGRSEEHTSELQSRFDLVCRLLLEKKKTKESAVDFYSKSIFHYHTS